MGDALLARLGTILCNYLGTGAPISQFLTTISFESLGSWMDGEWIYESQGDSWDDFCRPGQAKI